MRCLSDNQEGSALLLEYSAGKLETDTALQVRRHVEACAACQRLVEEQAAVWEALDVWAAEPISANFDVQLFAKIENQAPWWHFLLRPLRPVFLYSALPVAAA